MKTLTLFWGLLLLSMACTERPKGASGSAVAADSAPRALLQLMVRAHEGALLSLIVRAKDVEVDWGDGVEQAEHGATEYELRHRYAAAGEYKIGVRARAMRGFIVDSCAGVEAVSELSCTGCDSLRTLYCSASKLQKLDVRECPALAVLVCHSNALQELDVSRNARLSYLDCSRNDMRELSVAGCAGLRQLLCSSNKIEELNVAKNERLDFLDCSNNRLKSLSLLRNEAIYAVSCANNRMDSAALNALFTSLPDAEHIGDYCRIYVKGNDGAKLCNFTIASEKGWEVAQWW